MATVTLKIEPKDHSKLKKVIEVYNDRWNKSLRLVSADGYDCTIEYENVSDLFRLGRAYEPYKLPTVAGSITVGFDNSHVNKI